MRKIGMKKLLLYVSLLPYVYCIIMSLYHAMFGYSYDLVGFEDDYGFDAIGDFLGEYWLDNVFHFNFVSVANIFAIVYPIYYFVTSKKTNNDKVESNIRKINIKKILFVISVACWITYFMSGMYAFFFGYSAGLFESGIVYGFEALENALVWNLLIFSAIPILPITLIYIIIYLIFRCKEKRKQNS